MAKKSKRTRGTSRPSNAPVEKEVKVSKQAVGGVTGAVLGAMVAGPLGALAGGFAGAVVGEQSARGRKPVKKTVETIRSEVREMKPLETLKSAAEKTTSLVKSKLSKSEKPKLASKPTTPKKKAKATSSKRTAKKSKSKSAAKTAKSKRPKSTR